MHYIIAVIIGIIAGFVISGIQKSALTSVKMQHAATDYLQKNTLKYSVKTDNFLYRRVEKKPRPKN